MPIDEYGDKWACEPCIRGHRSTRCEHFDRFMMRVKRPGRPLSQCPHTGPNCQCTQERVIMVRIPKAAGCRCTRAENYHKMMETIRRAEERQALQAAGIPPANEFIPIESQPNGLLMASAPQAQEPSSAFQFNDLSMALPGFDPNEKSLNEQSSVPQANGGDMTNPVFNGGHALVSDGVSDHSSSFLTLASVGISNHSSPFPGGAGLALGGCSDHSTPFPAPPEPLPDIYRPLPDFIPPQFPPFGNDGAMAPPAEAFFPNDLLNLCKCGPNCQCEMCAVHPYNPTAQSHMQDLANFMVSDLGNPGPFYNEAFPGPPYSSGADAGLLGNLGGLTEGTGDGQLTMNGYHTNVDIDGDDIDSNAYPDGGMSAAQEPTQHLIHSDDYYTIQYPFPNICSTFDGSCRCGENCTCEGCRTHTGHKP